MSLSSYILQLLFKLRVLQRQFISERFVLNYQVSGIRRNVLKLLLKVFHVLLQLSDPGLVTQQQRGKLNGIQSPRAYF